MKHSPVDLIGTDNYNNHLEGAFDNIKSGDNENLSISASKDEKSKSTDKNKQILKSLLSSNLTPKTG